MAVRVGRVVVVAKPVAFLTYFLPCPLPTSFCFRETSEDVLGNCFFVMQDVEAGAVVVIDASVVMVAAVRSVVVVVEVLPGAGDNADVIQRCFFLS